MLQLELRCVLLLVSLHVIIFMVDLMRKEKKKRKNTKFENFLLFIAVALTIQLCLTGFQQSRYIRGKYDCVDMSKDCEAFFETLGINTEVRWGKQHGEDVGHCWIAIYTAFGWIEFESTTLSFALISSDDYQTIYHDVGWIYNGYYTNKQPLEPIPVIGK